MPLQVIKQQRSKQSKQKWGAEVAVQKAIEEIEAAHQAELLEHDRAAFAEVCVCVCVCVLEGGGGEYILCMACVLRNGWIVKTRY